MASFEDVWSRIQACAGQQFHTKTGLPFVYRVDGQSVIPDRTGYPIDVSQFQIARDMMPFEGPGEISTAVRGPAYVYAILTDPRTRAD